MADDIEVRFGADTGNLNSGVDEVKDKIKETGDAAGETGSAFEELGQKLAAAFTVDKIVETIEKMAELGEQIERVARLTGLSTDDVQNFQYAVERTGGNADSAGQSLLRFENNLAKAQQGTGPAAAAYEALGVKLFDVDGKARSVKDVMGDVADKFSQTADGALKVEYATALGSRGFAQMIPFLDEGREGFEKLNDEFTKTGGRLAPDTVLALRQLNASLVDMKQTWQGAWAEMVKATTGGGINIFVEGIKAIGEGFKQDAIWIEQATDCLKEFFKVQQGQVAGHDQWGGHWDQDKPKTVNEATFLGPDGQPIKPELNSLGGNSTAPDNSQELDDIKTQEQLAKLHLETQKAILGQEQAAHELTKQQEIEQEKQYADQAYAIDKDALQQKLGLYDEDSKEYNATLNQMQVLDAAHTAQIAKLDEQMAQANAKSAQETQKAWTDALNTIDKSFDTMLSGVLQGTQTWQQAMAKTFDNLAITFIEAVAKMLIRWSAFELATAGGFGATAKAIGNPFSSQGGSGGDSTMTALITALGLNTTAQTVSATATTTNAAVTTTNAAVTEVNTTTQSSNVLAWIGNTAATVANTIATEASDIGKLFSFDVGTPSLPFTGPILAHKGEMILPPDISAAVRSGNMTVGAGPFGGASVAGSSSTSITINAVDAQSVANLLKNNASVITGIVQRASRNFSPNVPAWKAN